MLAQQRHLTSHCTAVENKQIKTSLMCLVVNSTSNYNYEFFLCEMGNGAKHRSIQVHVIPYHIVLDSKTV